MSKIFVRSAYNYDMDQASKDTGLKCLDETMAQQNFKEECDINTIVERFKLTGTVPQLQELPAYADYEGIFDFQTAMNVIRTANEEFMAMPANIRSRFHNNPQEFLEFCNDPENLPEAQKLGILSPEAVQRLTARADDTQAGGAATTATSTPAGSQKPSGKGGKPRAAEPEPDQ